MCQLTYIDLGAATPNKIAAVIMMRENSRTLHKDGCGVFNPMSGLVKSEKHAAALPLLGSSLRKGRMNNDPLICHVRNATTTLDKKLLTVEHAHPFASKHFVLAHNGSLVFKDALNEEEYKTKDVIDSEIFLMELEKSYTGDVLADLTKTMDLFRGKFAFLIYHIPERKYYIVRGKTALLHYSIVYLPDEKEGMIINTELESMVQGLASVQNVLGALGIEVRFSAPIILDAESVYRIDDRKLVKIGDLKETPKEVASANTNFPVRQNYLPSTIGGASPTTDNTAGATTKYINRLAAKNDLTLIELDWLAFVLLNKGLLDFVHDDLRRFSKALFELEKRNNPKYKKLWQAMRMFNTPVDLYRKYQSLQFPYFLTEMKDYKRIFNSEKLAQETKGHKVDVELQDE